MLPFIFIYRSKLPSTSLPCCLVLAREFPSREVSRSQGLGGAIRSPLHVRMRTQSVRFLMAIAFSFAGHATANEITGKVVEVVDGDTVDVRTDSKEVLRVRVAGIDAPEKGQPFVQAAKRAMADLVFGQEVRVSWRKLDRYGRVVGKLEKSSLDTGLAMIDRGLAWHYKQYQSEQTSVDRTLYASAEVRARADRRGLWADAAPIAPWEFRHLPAGAAAAIVNPSACSCATVATCLGPRGGVYCFSSLGSKHYSRQTP